MKRSSAFLGPAAAASRLGVSAKALRLYEARGLIVPGRTAAGWRTYGPDDLTRAGEIVALRGLGLSLQQVARVLAGDPASLEPALARHQRALESQMQALAAQAGKLRALRQELASGRPPALGRYPRPDHAAAGAALAFALPWPWGGERFALPAIPRLTYITGPLFSGKTRLARRLAEAIPGAAFLGLDRLRDDAAAARAALAADGALRSRVEEAMAGLDAAGAAGSAALLALLAGLEREGASALVVDMVEEGLDEATQVALAARLRRGWPGTRPLFLLTRSRAILDLEAVGPRDSIILCPANHSPPVIVEPHSGAAGYEGVALCLGAPSVRARSAGVVATWGAVA